MGTPDDEQSWKRHAACRNLDVNMFHGTSKTNHEKCKKVCAGCPVVDECLSFALPFDKQYGWDPQVGIFGGLTTEERRLLWDRIRRAGQPNRRVRTHAR